MSHDPSSTRLDDFVDAAFAFAVTLLVIGGGAPPQSWPELATAMSRIPAFAIGFMLIGMFWHAHVRWRRLCGSGSFAAVLLSLALVFLVLVYVYPLRMMADSMVSYMTGGQGSLDGGGLRGLFTLYGLGFAGMSGLVAALFATGLKLAAPAHRRVITGELGIWLILAGSGALSVLLAQFRVTAPFSPFVYALLPIVIPVFAFRHSWDEVPEGQ